MEFFINDIVWAKMGRFRPWPGKIARPTPNCLAPHIKKPQHFVYFYGTHNFAWIPDENIKIHSENQLAAYKRSKKPPRSLVMAVKELLAELQAEELFKKQMQKTCQDLEGSEDEEEEIGKGRKRSKAVEEGKKRGVKRLHEDENKQSRKRRKVVETTHAEEKRKQLEMEKKKLQEEKKRMREEKRIRKLEEKEEKKRMREEEKQRRKEEESRMHMERKQKMEEKKRLLERKKKIEEEERKMMDRIQRTRASDIEEIPQDPSPANEQRNTTPQLLENPQNEESSVNLSQIKPEIPRDPENSWYPGTKVVGFIGCGDIGSRLISRLLFSGHKMVLWNRTRDKLNEFSDRARVASSYREVVEQSDIILNCVQNGEVTKQLLGDAFPEIRLWSENSGPFQLQRTFPLRGKGFVQLSSSSKENVEFVAKCISMLGGTCLMASMNGLLQEAERGKMTVMASGDCQLYEDCIPCFSSICRVRNWLCEEHSTAGILMLICSMFNHRALEFCSLLTRMALSDNTSPTDFMNLVLNGSIDVKTLSSDFEALVKAQIEIDKKEHQLQWVNSYFNRYKECV